MATRRLAQTLMAVGVTELDGDRFKFDTTTKRKRAEPRQAQRIPFFGRFAPLQGGTQGEGALRQPHLKCTADGSTAP